LILANSKARGAASGTILANVSSFIDSNASTVISSARTITKNSNEMWDYVYTNYASMQYNWHS